MKIVIAFLALVIVAVVSEPCHDSHQCAEHGITLCSQPTHVVCHHQQCECTDPHHSGRSCAALSDCPNCDHGHEHCIDQVCHCTRD